MQVHVAPADITKLSVDAVVNLANSQGKMSEGFALALAELGGRSIEEQATNAAPIAIGAALLTDGGDLSIKFIIHAPVVAAPGDVCTTEDLRRAARAALLASSAKKFKVIAIPGLPDYEGIPQDEVARSIVEEIRTHKSDFPETIYLVDTDPEMLEAFEDAVSQGV